VGPCGRRTAIDYALPHRSVRLRTPCGEPSPLLGTSALEKTSSVARSRYGRQGITPPRSTAASTAGCTPPQPRFLLREVARYGRPRRILGRLRSPRDFLQRDFGVLPGDCSRRVLFLCQANRNLHSSAKRAAITSSPFIASMNLRSVPT